MSTALVKRGTYLPFEARALASALALEVIMRVKSRIDPRLVAEHRNSVRRLTFWMEQYDRYCFSLNIWPDILDGD